MDWDGLGLWSVVLNFFVMLFLELLGGLEVELVGSVVQGLQELSGVVKGGGNNGEPGGGLEVLF